MSGPMPVTVVCPWTQAEWATPLRDVLAAAEAFPGKPMAVRVSEPDLIAAYVTREVGAALARVRDDPNAGGSLAGLFSALLRLPVAVVPGMPSGCVGVGPNAVLVGVAP